MTTPKNPQTFKMVIPQKQNITLPSFQELENSALRKSNDANYNTHVGQTYSFPNQYHYQTPTYRGLRVQTDYSKNPNISPKKSPLNPDEDFDEDDEDDDYGARGSLMTPKRHTRQNSLLMNDNQQFQFPKGHSKQNSLLDGSEVASLIPWSYRTNGHKRQRSISSSFGVQRKHINNEIHDKIETFKSVENSLITFSFINNIMNDVNKDLKHKIDHQNINNADIKVPLKIISEQESDKFLNYNTMDEFLTDIPDELLDSMIHSGNQFLKGLTNWKHFKEMAALKPPPIALSSASLEPFSHIRGPPRPMISDNINPAFERPVLLQTSSGPVEPVGPKIPKIQSSKSAGAYIPTQNETPKLQQAPIITSNNKDFPTIPSPTSCSTSPIKKSPIRKRHLRSSSSTNDIKSSSMENRKKEDSMITLRLDPPVVSDPEKATLDIQPPSKKAQGQLHHELSLKPNLSCMQCGRKDTPEWRRGPDGARTLCNACGLYHSKLYKKMGLAKANAHMLDLRKKGITDLRKIPKI